MFLLAFVLMIAAGFSFAGTVPYKFNGVNVTREGGATYLRGTSPSEVASAGVSVSNHVVSASGAANWYAGTGALVQNGAVVFNAAIPIAATAASVAVTAVRANPAGLVTSAVVSYLLTKGIELVDGEFKKATTGPSPTETETIPVTAEGRLWNDGYGQFKPWSQAHSTSCSLWIQNNNAGGWWTLVGPASQSEPSPPANTATFQCRVLDGSTQSQMNVNALGTTANGINYTCPDGYTISGTNCTRPKQVTTYQPLTESDWDAARSGYWPDPAILDLVKKGVPLPTDAPVFSPTYQDDPVGDPYVDPVTGKRYQDKARITPSTTNPSQADVQVFKQEIDANGQPVISPGTGQPVPPEKQQEDPCKLNPDRVGCKNLGTPDDIDLEIQERGVSAITVQSFGSNATCPQPIPLPKGASLSFQYPCAMAEGVKPFLLALAWLVAGFIIIGAVREA